MIIQAVTGHRPDKLGGYSDETNERLLAFARHWIGGMNNNGLYITGMAQGWDMAVAEACCDLGRKWYAYLPCIGQESQWPEAARKRYFSLLAEANRVVYVLYRPYPGPWVMFKRNEAMVDDCTHVVSLWDGSGGGTKHCVDYANYRGRFSHNLWDRWLEFNQ